MFLWGAFTINADRPDGRSARRLPWKRCPAPTHSLRRASLRRTHNRRLCGAPRSPHSAATQTVTVTAPGPVAPGKAQLHPLYLHGLILGVDGRVPQGGVEGPKHVPCASPPVKDGSAQACPHLCSQTHFKNSLRERTQTTSPCPLP